MTPTQRRKLRIAALRLLLHSASDFARRFADLVESVPERELVVALKEINATLIARLQLLERAKAKEVFQNDTH